MKHKCEMNLSVAKSLSQGRDSAGWTASIHCSYYAVFQYMKYILAIKARKPIAYEVQDSRSGEDSHKHILEEIRNRISSSAEERSIRDTVEWLKKSRILADYKDKLFTQEEALERSEKADSVVSKLTKLFSA